MTRSFITVQRMLFNSILDSNFSKLLKLVIVFCKHCVCFELHNNLTESCNSKRDVIIFQFSNFNFAEPTIT